MRFIFVPMKPPMENPVRLSEQPSTGNAEKRFLDMLKNIFIGVPIEGDSGFVNLMRIKSTYFEKVMEDKLLKEIKEAIKDFPDFRDELFDKLYSFFRRYFTESGSIGFFFTPYHQSVYEQVYTNEQDVVLFWKTTRLYYVKTDRLFQSMKVEVDGFRFHFDVSQLEHKRANEKRELIYTFQKFQQDDKTQTPQDDKTKTQRNDKTEPQQDDKTKKMTIVFTVHYSERGRQTKINNIRCAIRKALGLSRYTDAVPSEETLQKAFRIFERQGEVDYFLCKDAKSFLREQFDLWMWQYLLGKPGEESHTTWTETRLAQLQALKHIAYRVIDYIAAFEDELVKIWNKPKFVLKSHYVITLDRIAAQPGGEAILERLWAHSNMEEQLQEWRELGMVSEDFTLEDLLLPPPAASNPQQNLFEVAEARGLITNGYHLPYNPDLVERARELRRHMTPAEEKLWEYLKYAPYRFLRQRPIDHFIVDFYCPALRLVIEVDGEQHYTEEGKAYDAERDAILQGYGLRVVRFRNEEVLHQFESVCRRIEAAFGSPLTPSLSGVGSPLTPSLSPLGKGEEGVGSGGILSEGEGSGGIHPRYRYLPIDTKHFPDLELPIVALFDNLDKALDGWLIKSENYQALNTILPKFRGRVRCIYIDPPYNSKTTEIAYINRYKHSSWLTLMENRLRLSKWFATKDGSHVVAIDENEQEVLGRLLSLIFPDHEKVCIAIIHNKKGIQGRYFSYNHEYAFFCIPPALPKVNGISIPEQEWEYDNLRKWGRESERATARNCFYPIIVKDKTIIGFGDVCPDDFHPESANVKDGDRVLVYPVDPKGIERKWRYSRDSIEEIRHLLKVHIVQSTGEVQIHKAKAEKTIKTVWDDPRYIAGDYGTKWLTDLGLKVSEDFYPKSVHTVADSVFAVSEKQSLILDFFAGSGTTAHAVINLNREDGGRRKYILVEMADYFYTVLLPRVKKVVFSDKWKDGRAQPDGNGISHFVKYYELEQFEDALRRTRYAEDDLFTLPANEDPCQYIFLRDLKMLEALEVNLEQGTVQVDLSRLYENIDLPETLSNLTGKWIRRIEPDPNDPRVPAAVVFTDGEQVSLSALDWRMIRPLVWW